MAATYGKFNAFVASLANGTFNLGSDTLKLALTNSAPSATDATLADITQISSGTGYTSGGAAVTVTGSSQSAGLYKLVASNVVFTASGGSIGPFRYAVLYDTSASNKLIGYWDIGSNVTVTDTNTYTFKPSASNGMLQIQ